MVNIPYPQVNIYWERNKKYYINKMILQSQQQQ